MHNCRKTRWWRKENDTAKAECGKWKIDNGKWTTKHGNGKSKLRSCGNIQKSGLFCRDFTNIDAILAVADVFLTTNQSPLFPLPLLSSLLHIYINIVRENGRKLWNYKKTGGEKKSHIANKKNQIEREKQKRWKIEERQRKKVNFYK